MKNIFRNILVLSLILIAMGCQKDFLEEKMYSALDTDNFFKTQQDLEKGVVGAYNALQPKPAFGKSILLMAEYPTEIMRDYWNHALDVYNLTAGVGEDVNQRDVQEFWQQSWTINNQTNMVINRAADITMDDNVRNKIVAEAKFIRALNRFYQVRFYGTNIPLINNETTSLDELDVMPSNKADLYASIIEDFTAAETYLPPSSPEGRATSWAATALLGKVYLTMAGYAENPATGAIEKGDPANYQMAKKYLEKVINQGPFKLMPNFSDIWGDQQNNGELNAEVIFSVRYKQGGLGEGNQWTPSFVGKGNGWAAYSFKTASSTWKFYDSYNAVDTRKALLNVKYQDNKGVWKNDDYPHLFKYVSDLDLTLSKKWSVTGSNDYGDDIIVIRFADVLLMHSEVINEIEGATTNALVGINRVRERAKLKPYTIVDLAAMSVINGETPGSNKDKLRELIILERKWELVGEGHGWLDYVRLNILTRELSKGYEYGNFNASAAMKYNLFPIFNVDIQLNKNLKQNFGW